MKKILMVAVMLIGLSFASFAKEKASNKEQKDTKQNTVYCYTGATDCGTTYSACLSWQLTSEEQIALQQTRTRADCGSGEPEEETVD